MSPIPTIPVHATGRTARPIITRCSRVVRRVGVLIAATAMILAPEVVHADTDHPINDPATGLMVASRLNPPPPPPIWPTGLYNLPYAPFGLTDCQEMAFYARQFGLPTAFDGIGWRESNCRNEDGVHTSCCWGYWQLHQMHFPMPECFANSYRDVNSDDPLEKQKQACAAKQLYDAVGLSPWSATR